jgi:hypothetical protein
MKTFRLFILSVFILFGSTAARCQDIFDAIEKINIEKVKALVGAEPQVLTITDENKDTPLHHAARQKQPEMVLYLISKGAEVNSRNTNLRTPLHLSANAGSKECTKILIEKGADIPVEGQSAQLIFNSACQQGLAKLFNKQVEKGIEIPLTDNQQGTLLHDAAKGGSPEIIEGLIRKGLKAGSKDKYGWTPLHYAALNNRTEAIEMLLMKGADINARTIMGQSAYNVAEEYGRVQAKDLLTGRGADLSPMLFPKLEGRYLGQKIPDTIPEIFALGIISSVWGLHSSLAFSPDGNEVYWSPMIEIPGQTYSEGGIWYMKRINNQWTPPEPAPFSGRERQHLFCL